MYFICVFIGSTQWRKQETCRKFNFETLFMTVNLIPFHSILINVVYLCICVQIYVCFVCVCVCMYVCMYVLYVYVYVCMYVCMYVDYVCM